MKAEYSNIESIIIMNKVFHYKVLYQLLTNKPLNPNLDVFPTSRFTHTHLLVDYIMEDFF